MDCALPLPGAVLISLNILLSQGQFQLCKLVSGDQGLVTVGTCLALLVGPAIDGDHD